MHSKEDVRIAYFGDNYISDVYSSNLMTNWHGFPIIEEMTHHDSDYAEGRDPKLVKCNKYWGDDYFGEMIDENTYKKNYFVHMAEQCSRYALPLLKNIRHLMKWFLIFFYLLNHIICDAMHI